VYQPPPPTIPREKIGSLVIPREEGWRKDGGRGAELSKTDLLSQGEVASWARSKRPYADKTGSVVYCLASTLAQPLPGHWQGVHWQSGEKTIGCTLYRRCCFETAGGQAEIDSTSLAVGALLAAQLMGRELPRGRTRSWFDASQNLVLHTPPAKRPD
jgi:hypothetical protein